MTKPATINAMAHSKPPVASGSGGSGIAKCRKSACSTSGWKRINRKTHPWSSNQWVWAVAFKPTEAVRMAQ